jgi:hypothetical protein
MERKSWKDFLTEQEKMDLEDAREAFFKMERELKMTCYHRREEAKKNLTPEEKIERDIARLKRKLEKLKNSKEDN